MPPRSDRLDPPQAPHDPPTEAGHLPPRSDLRGRIPIPRRLTSDTTRSRPHFPYALTTVCFPGIGCPVIGIGRLQHIGLGGNVLGEFVGASVQIMQRGNCPSPDIGGIFLAILFAIMALSPTEVRGDTAFWQAPSASEPQPAKSARQRASRLPPGARPPGARLPGAGRAGAPSKSAAWLWPPSTAPDEAGPATAKPGARAARKEDGDRDKRPAALVGDHFAPTVPGRWQWKIVNAAWTAEDEDWFGEFIRQIGESDCKTTHECLTSPRANPQFHDANPPGMQFFADCADLPFYLRAYFAWHNGLPFSFSTAVSLHPGTAVRANEPPSFQISGRYHIVPPGPDPRLAMQEVARVSTAHFRHPANYRGRMLPDHYPVAITRDSIKAGTVIFDPLGHIAVVYKVDEHGRVHFIDAHPDNSLTRGVYDSEIERAGPDSGAGFKRWRPQTLIGARRGANGGLSGGRLVLTRDERLPDWSDEQYHGTGSGRSASWKSARFLIDGDEVDYHAFIRLRLAPAGYRFDPIDETRQRIRNICRELDQRVAAVDFAVRAGIHKRPQPPRLPQNIYVTQGDWETYSTPSRDAQLKSMFRALREDVARFLALAPSGGRFIRHDGIDLGAELLTTYRAEADACQIRYTKSDGETVELDFSELKRRLFLMSFDPHHCPERRWGATDPRELASCRDDKTKAAWYEAQQRLRNQLVRTIGDRMDFTLDDLRRQAREESDVGEDEAPDIDVATLLAR